MRTGMRILFSLGMAILLPRLRDQNKFLARGGHTGGTPTGRARLPLPHRGISRLIPWLVNTWAPTKTLVLIVETNFRR